MAEAERTVVQSLTQTVAYADDMEVMDFTQKKLRQCSKKFSNRSIEQRTAEKLEQN